MKEPSDIGMALSRLWASEKAMSRANNWLSRAEGSLGRFVKKALPILTFLCVGVGQGLATVFESV